LLIILGRYVPQAQLAEFDAMDCRDRGCRAGDGVPAGTRTDRINGGEPNDRAHRIRGGCLFYPSHLAAALCTIEFAARAGEGSFRGGVCFVPFISIHHDPAADE
jgi:hypothetical protein